MTDIEIAAIEQLFGNFQYEIYARGLAGETPDGRSRRPGSNARRRKR